MSKTIIRKRKTEHKPQPAQTSADWTAWSNFRYQLAAQKGFSRPRFGPLVTKDQTSQSVTDKWVKKSNRTQKTANIRVEKKLKHDMNAGKRAQIKQWRKERKLKLAL